jgi:hypothetical protein
MQSQVIVQRALAAKNLIHAKAGCIVAGLLNSLLMFFNRFGKYFGIY